MIEQDISKVIHALIIRNIEHHKNTCPIKRKNNKHIRTIAVFDNNFHPFWNEKSVIEKMY